MAFFNRKNQGVGKAASSRVNQNTAVGADEQQNAIAQQTDWFAEVRKKVSETASGEKTETHDVWKRQPKAYTMILMVVLIVAIFIFFLLTPVLFTGGAKDVGDPTQLGSAVSLSNGTSVTVTSWTYAPSQGRMEIKMNVDRGDYIQADSMEFQASLKHGNEKNLAVHAVVQDDDYVVLIVTGIPSKWTALYVDIYSLAAIQQASTQQNAQVESLGSIMCLEKGVSQVSSITPKTPEEYRADVYLDQIPPYQQKIDSDKQQIAQNKKAIAGIENSLAHMAKEAGKPMPQDKQAELSSQMEDARAQEESLKEENKDLESDITSNETVIASLRAKASYYTD